MFEERIKLSFNKFDLVLRIVLKTTMDTLPKDHPWNNLKLEFKENVKPKSILKNIKHEEQEEQEECCLTRKKLKTKRSINHCLIM